MGRDGKQGPGAAHRDRPSARRRTLTRQKAHGVSYSSHPMRFKLTSADNLQTYELKPGAAQVVGRAPTSDIPVFDPTISRRHAELVVADGGVQVHDLGSSNGTFLNGTRIEN